MPAWLAALAGLSVPALFWLFRYLHWPFWLVGLALLPLAWRRRNALPGMAWLAPVAALCGGVALVARNDLPVRLYPVLVNACLLLVFALSLRAPQTVIERLARLTDPDLPPSGVRYTRKVTMVWCGFFALNGTLALLTVLWGDARIWALYNGVIAYIAMACLFAGEWLVRQRVRRDEQH